MDQERFDRITRTLASGRSRRSMFGLLAGGLAVAFGGGLHSALAQVEAGGNSVCAKRCQELFSPGKERGRCVADGARGQGPCAELEQCIGVPISSNPVKTITFAPTGDSNFCGVFVNLSGYAGCTTYNAEYYRRYRGNQQLIGNVTLGPTDSSGSSSTSLGTYAKSGELDVRIDGVASDYTAVNC